MDNRLNAVLAWCVHIYTATGLVLAAAMAVLIVAGDLKSMVGALLLMWAATLIDATDGTLARRLKVKELIPYFDGRRLDDLTDFLTYVFLPLLFVWRTGLLDHYFLWLFFPLLSGAYGFCQRDSKTDDGFFLGFPSYWNIVAMYLFLLRPDPNVALGTILFFSGLTFVPLKYLYPVRPGKLNRTTNVLGILWASILLWIFVSYYRDILKGQEILLPELLSWLRISIFFPIYYLIASWWVNYRRKY